MTDSMTPGNRLYLYRLLSEELGFGKQVTIERAEEILAADDVQPADVGFESARAMMESKHFQGSARVDVFKKGRVLLTMLRNPELDGQLQEAAKAEEEKQAAKAAAGGGAKSTGKPTKGGGKAGPGARGGKNQWAGVKATLKPSKPGEQRRKQEAKAAKAAAEAQAKLEAQLKAEREAREAAERAEAERIAREEAERLAREAAEKAAREAEEQARREAEARKAAQQAKQQARQRALDEQRARVTTPVSELKSGLRVTFDPYTDPHFEPAGSPFAGRHDAATGHATDKANATFGAGKVAKRPVKKNVPNPNYVPGQDSSPSSHTQRMLEDVAASDGRRGVTKRRTHRADAKNAPKVAAPAQASPAGNEWLMPTYSEAADFAPVDMAPANATVAGVAAADAVRAVHGDQEPASPIKNVAVFSVDASERADEAPHAASTETSAQPFVEPTASAGNDVAASPVEQAATGMSQPNVSDIPDVKPATPTAPAPVRPASPRLSPNPDRQVPSAEVLADYPQSISGDVFCPTAILSTLSRVLPIEVDLMAVLDEDWAAARAMGTVCGSRSRAVFPLRYLREDGSRPVELTLKRTGKPGLNMRWAIALVDGDDGTGDMHETASLEGLPLADEGAWHDLAAPSRAMRSGAGGPIREFATFATIGTWDALCGDLARMAAPERWSYPGTEILPSVAGDTRYGVLREYLAVTFHRVCAQGKLGIGPAKDFAAFNTGLATPSGDDIFACFEPCRSNTPWRFAGFALAGSGELGSRITCELEAVPQAATYLETLADVAPAPDARVALDFRTLLDDCLGQLPRGFLRNALADMEGPSGMLDRMADAVLSPLARHEAQTKLTRFISDAPNVYRRLTRDLDDAAAAALAMCRRSYRTAVPVFDATTDAMKLLLPLCLVNPGRADVALAVQRQPSGVWQGTRLLSLPRAYACARVVSSEQPSWLAAERVLG